MAAGTADYMSPEQAVGRDDLDGRSDLYSLGCVMYQLLTGKVPFPEESRVECLASRIKGQPAPLAEVRPGLPPALVSVVERLLANRRDDRYATAAEAAEPLRALGGETPPVPSDPERPWYGRGLRAEPLSPSSSSIIVADVSQDETPISRHAGEGPAAAPDWWLRLLAYLLGWSPMVALLVAALALLLPFVAGFVLSRAIG